MTRTLLATVGRRDGGEAMVAALAGEVQVEGEILPNYFSNLEIYWISRFLKLFVCLPNI